MKRPSNIPDVQFVMCHIGNPFLQDAIAVLEKNHNVAVDLSGLLEGKIPDMVTFLRDKRGLYFHAPGLAELPRLL